MARNLRKQTSTKKQKGAGKPAALKKESPTTQSKKDDEGWGPVGEVAKRAAKGAVKGAAKELSKK